MYLRVMVREADRGSLRFLWHGSDRQKYPETYEMRCIIFGANSSPCNALYIKDINAKEFASIKPRASESIIKNSYVDDFLSSEIIRQSASASSGSLDSQENHDFESGQNRSAWVLRCLYPRIWGVSLSQGNRRFGTWLN